MSTIESDVPEHFETFDLAIERAGDAYWARVVASPVGPRQPVRLDLSQVEPAFDRAVTGPGEADSGEPDLASDSRGSLDRGTAGEGDEREIRRPSRGKDPWRVRGEALFRAVFVDDVVECYRQSLEHQRAVAGGLALRLFFDGAPELASQPWEALRDPKLRQYLVDAPNLVIVRGLSVPSDPAEPRHGTPPLAVAALLPEPRGEVELTGAAEWAKIRQHLADFLDSRAVVGERVQPASLEGLKNYLRRSRCDVLHIVAHGGAGEARDGGVLRLETESGRADEVTGDELAGVLGRRPPRLVVLGACHGGRSRGDDAFDGLAQHLLGHGVRAVVAMCGPISDGAAAELASSLYRELSQGRTVEAAMVEARHDLKAGRHRTEWATPVLYLRSSNLRIFPPEALGPAVRRRRGRVGLAALAILGAAALGLAFGWGRADRPDPRCPSPPGLEDLEFVYVQEGSVDLDEGYTLVVKKPFCIATKEVTRRDWTEVMGEPERRHDWPDTAPMSDITIDQARAFAAQLGERDLEGTYRLPVVTEWEWAARGGAPAAETRYFFGDDPAELPRYGNCRSDTGSDGFDGIAPVGQYEPNALGLYDVHGNVREWVEWAAPDSDHPRGAGTEQGTSPYYEKFDADQGWYVALAVGGSFENTPENCAFGAEHPGLKLTELRPNAGFRVVRDPLPEP